MDDFSTSKDFLEKSIKIEDSEDKRYLLAEIYIQEGNTKEAVKEYNKLLSSNPNNINYVVPLVNTYILNRDFLKARKVLKTFIKNNPTEISNPVFKPYGILKIFL
jgi:tetratricopeptide (TPR) repeat protein